MSLQRIILISGTAHISGYIERDGYTTPKPPAPNQGVNVVLGGTMMGGIIVMVFLICYCCHRNQQNRHTHLPQYWRDPGLSMEVYTVEGPQMFEIHEEHQRPAHQGPPPSYESVIKPDDDKNKAELDNEIHEPRNYDMDLPTYEDAIEMARRDGKII
ncbi:hypothetical protein FQR65_LT03123 [Abscondita terminalis]|nr:hypothetical protein FQR65_LT03123 [Abscondita terminalis]